MCPIMLLRTVSPIRCTPWQIFENRGAYACTLIRHLIVTIFSFAVLTETAATDSTPCGVFWRTSVTPATPAQAATQTRPGRPETVGSGRQRPATVCHLLMTSPTTSSRLDMSQEEATGETACSRLPSMFRSTGKALPHLKVVLTAWKNWTAWWLFIGNRVAL